MRKLFIIVFAAIAVMMAGNTAKAQCAFPDGSVGINLGLGLASDDYGYDHHGSILIPSFNFALDYAFLPNIINQNGCISGGGYLSMGRGSNKHDLYKNIVNEWKVGTRGALHYTWVRNLDTYAGVGLGVKGAKSKTKVKHVDEVYGPYKDTEFDCFGFGGVRYIMGNFAVYSELSTTNFAWFQIGISFVL